ncbi:glycosyltransferase [Bacillus benzoevorans]|uniref:Glycosyltransferase involved in cell wall biosynthesis n=1 Tax=Bacillus benzoevorans TaxID=1456 RepID=A0A7X0LXG1_9BACI|nr:glycosyltransferase [Bacillus benzoevorans]MBB6447580.1 glycosyltransferase involved in cell wall biosynthesis [Bacillus benzoevorans]
MRIALVNLVSVDGGGLAVLKDFYEYLKENKENKIKWLFIVSNQQLESTENIQVINLSKTKMNVFGRAYAEMKRIPSILKQYKPNVVLSMQNTTLRYKNAVQMIYMHQSLPFQKEYNFSIFRRGEFDCAIRQYILGYFIKKSLKKAKCIFVQTEWIKSAVKQYIESNSKVVKVGYNLPEFNNRVQHDRKISNKFFYPAGPAIYKNFILLDKAVNSLESQGYNNFKIFLTITKEEYIRATNIKGPISNKFVFLGRIPYKRVCNLYNESIVVFPSYIESLGLPLIEAMANNCFILASNCEFSKEVLGNYDNALYFNPFKEEEIINCMIKVLNGNVTIIPSAKVIKNEGNCWGKMMLEIKNLGGR